jgi:hypothetical protein
VLATSSSPSVILSFRLFVLYSQHPLPINFCPFRVVDLFFFTFLSSGWGPVFLHYGFCHGAAKDPAFCFAIFTLSMVFL